MKTTKQIEDRITQLESCQKDEIDASETLRTLNWAIDVREPDIKEEIINTAQLISNTSYKQSDISNMRDLLWILED